MKSLLPRREDFFSPLETHFNKFFDDFFKVGNQMKSMSQSDFPKINAYENEGHFHLVVAVPGTKSENLKVEVDDAHNTVTISGRMDEDYRVGEPDLRSSGPPGVDRIYLRELRTSAFQRTLQLPEGVSGSPEATLKEGILNLQWKVTKNDEPVIRAIPIKTT